MESNATAELTAKSISERRTAVALDLDSRKDMYASIDPFALAELLGIDEPRHPRGGKHPWTPLRYVPPITIGEYLAWNDWLPVAEALEDIVSEERISVIEALLEGDDCDQEQFWTEQLSESEQEAILSKIYEHQIDDGPYIPLAITSVLTKDGNELRFEAQIEDDGSCVVLLTPYDYREGRFTDIENGYYESW